MLQILREPGLTSPTLIGGLPGVGNVGKIAAEYLAIGVNAQVFGEVYSDRFPARVFNSEGIEVMKNKLSFWKGSNQDLIILHGNSQPADVLGMYSLSWEILEAARRMGAKEVITLAAYITGKDVKNPRVYGAATDSEVLEELRKYGVERMAAGTISGVNGLLPAMAALFKMRGICLLGETSGYDPSDLSASMALLKTLTRILGININLSGIEKAAEIKNRLIEKTIRDRARALKRQRDGFLMPYG